MPFWHRTPRDGPDEAEERRRLEALASQTLALARRRAAADAKLLVQGGIPTMARERLQAQAQGGDTFTSDLTPDEAALLRQAGYRPLGLVGGSTMYRVGVARHSSVRDGEIKRLSKAYDEATALAVERMRQEAAMLGGHGVVGVRFALQRHEWGEDTVEVTVVGTAVAGPGGAPAAAWLSDLSGQEWWGLHRAGYVPTGLAFGHCSWFILTRAADQAMDAKLDNQEYEHFSRALMRCRDIAGGKLREMARTADADGVVGVHVLRHHEEVSTEEVELTGSKQREAGRRTHHLVTLSLIGTAVRRRADAQSMDAPVPTRLVVSLRTGGLAPTNMVTVPSAEE